MMDLRVRLGSGCYGTVSKRYKEIAIGCEIFKNAGMQKITDYPKGLWTAIVCLRISEVLYILLALLFGTFGTMGDLFGEKPTSQGEYFYILGFTIFFVFLSLGMAVFIEVVCRHLKQGKYWAWIAGLILCGIYVPSLFIVLGIIGLIGLLKPETRKYFEAQS